VGAADIIVHVTTLLHLTVCNREALLLGGKQDLGDGGVWQWVVTSTMIDPGHLTGNALPPPVHVENKSCRQQELFSGKDLSLLRYP